MNGDYLDHCCSEADRAQERIAEGYERLLRAALRVHREGNEAAPNPAVILSASVVEWDRVAA